MPLVFLDGVETSFSTLPVQSTSQAFSERSLGSAMLYATAAAPESFCSPIHRPSGVTAMPFGNPGGLLKSLVVFALRERIGWLRPLCVPLACANARAPLKPKPNARNSLFVIVISFSVEPNLPQSVYYMIYH